MTYDCEWFHFYDFIEKLYQRISDQRPGEIRLKTFEHGQHFVIVRGNSKPSFFSFFVDHDSSCWTTRSSMAQFYRERREAEKDISELRKRATLRRQAGRLAKQSNHESEVMHNESFA